MVSRMGREGDPYMVPFRCLFIVCIFREGITLERRSVSEYKHSLITMAQGPNRYGALL